MIQDMRSDAFLIITIVASLRIGGMCTDEWIRWECDVGK